MVIKKGDPDYQRLLEAWLQQKRPVNLYVGKKMYTAITPSDDVVVFEPQGGFENYDSQTRIPGSG